MKKIIGKPRSPVRTQVTSASPPVRETPGGEPPHPHTHRSYRRIVGVTPGTLVRVRGDRDGKYLVLAPPESEKRWLGRKTVTVDLLGPGGPVTVPLRFCTPYNP